MEPIDSLCKRATWAAAGLVAGVGLVGCAERPPREPVRGGDPVVFVWEASSGSATRGAISTVLPDGTHYSGSYFQITEVAREKAAGPSWGGWRPSWGMTSYWGLDNGQRRTVYYSGSVVAHLQSAGGERMRCQFTLAEPTRGLAGGGMGSCKLRDGSRIANVVLGVSARDGE